MFRILPALRGYDELFRRLLGAIPPGSFYDDFSKPIVAWNSKPANFILETDQFNVPVHITVERIGDYHQNVDSQNVVPETTIVPGNQKTNFQLTLGRGLNRIKATENYPGGRTTYIEVIATTNAIVLEPQARELFVSDNLYQSQKSALYSRLSTRMLDQVISFQNLLTGIEALKVMTTRLIVRGMVHFPARDIGVRNVIEAFSLNTPVFKDSRSFSKFHIERERILRPTEIEAGEEAHVWFPNLSVTRWLAFIRMADSLRQNYQIQDIKDNLVTVDYKGEEQKHLFDFNSPGSNFLTNLSVTDCFNNIDVTFNIHTLMQYKWCLWAYYFDEFVTPLTPIGQARTSLDLGVPFDQGLSFDADPVDPYTDGWVGWSLSGRFEQDVKNTHDAIYGLDSHVVPSRQYTGRQCIYNRGPYTQMLNSHNFEIPLDAKVEIKDAVWEDQYTQGPIVSLDLTLPPGPFVAGEPVLAAVKYVDQNLMTNSSGTGLVTIKESDDGDTEQVGVTQNGFQWFYLTPTIAGETIHWDLDDGVYQGTSQERRVLPGTFNKFLISHIGPQQVGIPFSVTIQAADKFNNPVQDIGINHVVQIDTIIGFPADTVQPSSVELVNGQATFQVTMLAAGNGALRFKLLPIENDSNIFTVF